MWVAEQLCVDLQFQHDVIVHTFIVFKKEQNMNELQLIN